MSAGTRLDSFLAAVVPAWLAVLILTSLTATSLCCLLIIR